MKRKQYIVASAIAAVALVGCGGSTTSSSSKETEKKENSGFDTSMMNKQESACNDFYSYSIGSWLKNNPIPSTESRWGSFEYLSEQNKKNIKQLIADIVAEDNLTVGSEKQQIKDLYLSTIDTVNREKIGVAPLASELERINNLSSKEDIFNYLIQAKKEGLGISTFGFYVGLDSKDSEKYAVNLSQGGLGLPDKDYYLSENEDKAKIREEYKKYVANLFKIATGKESPTIANDILNFETELAEVSMDRVKRRNPDNTYNKLTLDELKDLAPEFNWNSFFEAFNLKNVDYVIVNQPRFIKNWSRLFVEKDLSEWKKYLSWKMISASSGYLNDAMANESFHFNSTVLNGIKAQKPRWKRAQAMVDGYLGEPLGKVFVAKYFSEDSKKEMTALIENLRTAFRDRIHKLSWMSDETKKEALTKLNSFTYKIGYPDKWEDYSKVKITADNLFNNVKELRKYGFNKMIADYGQPVDKTRWLMNPQTINAYYHPVYNEVVFPAAILQPPFFNPNADKAINYGAIGAVIGHEFTHGFDDQGCKYNSHGNLKNWWKPEDKSRFDERANVMVEQFNGYEALPGVFVNGKLTLGENIADLGGLTLAYYALQKEYDGKEKPKDIDGFTYNQRLFLGWANVWKNNINDEALKNRITNDPHSPGEFRVNGTLGNMPEFKKAFSCKDSDAMIRSGEEQAKIW
jgi:putative endopeptidase